MIAPPAAPGSPSRLARSERPTRAATPLALAVAALAAMPLPAVGTIAAGRVTDRTTGAPVVGVAIRVERTGTVVGTAASGGDGAFLVTFEGGASAVGQAFTLHAEHDEYAPVSRVFSVTSGKPDQASYPLELLPRELSKCVQARSPAVLVGHFFGPHGTDGMDLTWQMSQALTYSLLTQLQRHGVRRELEPLFPRCQAAQLQAPDLGGSCARALGADALVFGRVKQVKGGFEVTTFIADSYEVFAPPAAFPNVGVDLEAPESAVFDPRTHAAILAVVAAGYAKKERFADCVEATVAAEQLGGKLTPQLKAVRDRCKKASGTAVLTKGGTP